MQREVYGEEIPPSGNLVGSILFELKGSIDRKRALDLGKDIATLPHMNELARRELVTKFLPPEVKIDIEEHGRAREHFGSIIDVCRHHPEAQQDLYRAISSLYGHLVPGFGPGNEHHVVVLNRAMATVSKGEIDHIVVELGRRAGEKLTLSLTVLHNASEGSGGFGPVTLFLRCTDAAFERLRTEDTSSLNELGIEEVRVPCPEEKWLYSILSTITSTGLRIWLRDGVDFTWSPPIDVEVKIEEKPEIKSPPLDEDIEIEEKPQVREAGFRLDVAGKFKLLVATAKDFLSKLVERLAEAVPTLARIFLFFFLFFAICLVVAFGVWWFVPRSTQQQAPEQKEVASTPPPPEETEDYVETPSAGWSPERDGVKLHIKAKPNKDGTERRLEYRVVVAHQQPRPNKIEARGVVTSSRATDIVLKKDGVRPKTYVLAEKKGKLTEISSDGLFSRDRAHTIKVNGQEVRIPSSVFEKARTKNGVVVHNGQLLIRANVIPSVSCSVTLWGIGSKGREMKPLTIPLGSGVFNIRALNEE